MAKKHTYKTNHPKYRRIVGTRLTRMRRRKLERLSEAQGHRCAYCCIETYQGKRPRGWSNDQCASLEHLIPQSEDVQTNKESNLVMACSNCNTLRAGTDPQKFYRRIRRESTLAKPSRKPKPLTVDQIVNEVLKDKKRWELCWIIAAMWPEEAAKVAEEWRLPLKRKERQPGRRKIAKLAAQVLADPKRLAA